MNTLFPFISPPLLLFLPASQLHKDFESSEQLSKAKGMWAPPHKDTGLLTLLVPGVFLDPEGHRVSGDPEVGLYVRDRQLSYVLYRIR